MTCQKNVLSYQRELALFFPFDIFGGYPLLSPDFPIITHESEGIFFALFVPCSNCYLGVFMKFLEGLICDCKQRHRKSKPLLQATFPLFTSSYGVEGVNEIFTFYTTIFFI